MKAIEVITITAREIIREVEIRVSRPVDRPEPCGPDAIDVTPRKRLIPKKPMRLVASKVAA